jgi:hypothetical protein
VGHFLLSTLPPTILPWLQDEEAAFEGVLEGMVLARQATLEQQVAGLRLLGAVLDCWGFQYPLTDEVGL